MPEESIRVTPTAAGRKRIAADIMTVRPRTCSPFHTVLEATAIIRHVDYGAVTVVDEGRPVGVVTDRDVVLALTEDPDLADRPVAEIMNRRMVAVQPDDPLVVVEEILTDRAVRRLLVIDSGARLVGIITRADLVARP